MIYSLGIHFRSLLVLHEKTRFEVPFFPLLNRRRSKRLSAVERQWWGNETPLSPINGRISAHIMINFIFIGLYFANMNGV